METLYFLGNILAWLLILLAAGHGLYSWIDTGLSKEERSKRLKGRLGQVYLLLALILSVFVLPKFSPIFLYPPISEVDADFQKSWIGKHAKKYFKEDEYGRVLDHIRSFYPLEENREELKSIFSTVLHILRARKAEKATGKSLVHYITTKSNFLKPYSLNQDNYCADLSSLTEEKRDEYVNITKSFLNEEDTTSIVTLHAPKEFMHFFRAKLYELIVAEYGSEKFQNELDDGIFTCDRIDQILLWTAVEDTNDQEDELYCLMQLLTPDVLAEYPLELSSMTARSLYKNTIPWED